MSDYHSFIERNLTRYVDELTRFGSIASVASTGVGIRDAAQFTADAFERRGLHAEIVESEGNPVVIAQGGAGARSILLYNHYDVQPADPIDAWTSDPFCPELRDGKLYGRGVIDDKGEIVARLAAIDALIDRFGTLPLRVITCIEGEEEAGSKSLGAFVRKHRDRLSADACIWEAGMVDEHGRPRLWLGVRGLLYVTLHVKTLAHDAHSGWAHALPNAAWRLVEALSTLKDSADAICVAGFYDGVRPPTPVQARLLKQMDDDEEAEYRREYGVRRFVADRSGPSLREAVFQPTCNISGIWSGHIDDGTKTVIPASAHARLDFRLVPDQDPDDLACKLRAHFDARSFTDVEIDAEEGSHAACSDPEHPFIALTVATLRENYGCEPLVAPLVGGTGPAAIFVRELGVPFASIGCSYPGARKHAPDENIRLSDFVRGAAAIASVMERFSTS